VEAAPAGEELTERASVQQDQARERPPRRSAEQPQRLVHHRMSPAFVNSC
jgi:hypothetical protein